MAGLSIPDDFPLNELVAQELNQLAIGRHSLSLKFARDRVDIEAGFEFQTEGNEIIRAGNSDLATPAANLFPLLGQCVTAVERLPNNEIRIQFGASGSLTLTIDDHGYEAYHLFVAGEYVTITKEW
jgi:hypothetical protein